MTPTTTFRTAASLVIIAITCLFATPGLAQEDLPAPEVDAPEFHIGDEHEWLGPSESFAELEFSHDEPSDLHKFFEAVPTILTTPNEPLGSFFADVLDTEHDHPETELDDYAIGIQHIPERRPLLLELNEDFLGPGFLDEGVVTPMGAVWRPSFWVFGQFRSALQYFERDRAVDPISEWTSRLDLFGQLNLSGTERLLIGMRPFDRERGGAREFASFDMNNGTWIDGGNANFQTLFFEGDFGEIFPHLDPYDTLMLDYGFSVGRMPLLAQQGLLINEDMIDAVTVTRNTLYGGGNLNFRATGVYAWRGINRNSPVGMPNNIDPGSRMVALLTESDFLSHTVNLDGVYVDGDDAFGDMYALAASAIGRYHGYENTYNLSLHALMSMPQGAPTPYADQGELFFAQTSWTPHHTEDLIYLNTFWAVDQFTSPTRGPAMGGPLGQTGVLFAGVGLGRYGAPIGVQTNNVAGASLGYQFFFDHTRQQLIWEFGGFSETKGVNRGSIGSAMRYQKAIGQHFIFRVEGFVAKQETRNTGQGARTELLIKF